MVNLSKSECAQNRNKRKRQEEICSFYRQNLSSWPNFKSIGRFLKKSMSFTENIKQHITNKIFGNRNKYISWVYWIHRRILSKSHIWRFLEWNSLSYNSKWGSERSCTRTTPGFQSHLLKVDHIWTFLEWNFLSYNSKWGSEQSSTRRTSGFQSHL